MPEIVEKVLLVVVGAVLGILLPLVRDFLGRRLRRPNVVIEVGNQDGCVYDNVLIKSYGTSGSVTSTGRDAIFVRARVTNTEGRFGRPEKAEGCIGYLAGLERWDAAAGDFVASSYQDFLRLEWSFNRETTGMDLLPGIPNWLDVCYVLPPKVVTLPELTAEEKKTRTMWSPPRTPAAEPAVLKIASNPPVHRYGAGFELPGLYRVTVQVSGKNFGARALRFYVLVPVGSVRPEILDESSWRSRLPALSAAEEAPLAAVS